MKSKTKLKAGQIFAFNQIIQINAGNRELLSRNNVSGLSVGGTAQNSGQSASIG
jgi:hypothetical protein